MIEDKAREYAKEIETILSRYHKGSVLAGISMEVYDAFIAGYNEACRWRLCSEELPKEGLSVLCANAYGIFMGSYEGEDTWLADGIGQVVISHWLPIPEIK